jgi:Tfp pilus assembly protein PilF
MIQACRSCGASPPSNSSHVSFVCEYCGTKNVDDQYFIERAKNIDASKANRYFGLGLVAFNSGDYQQAEKQFEQAVQEDDHNIDGWIYLAHTKAKTLKPSNFGKHILVAINCIKKAQEIDANAEIVQFGSAAIANSFLAESIAAAQYYFDTAEKKLVAFGKGGAAGVASEVQTGFSLLKDAFSLNPTDTRLIAASSIYAMSQTFRFDDLGIGSQQMKKDGAYFFDVLYGVYSKHKEVALEVLAQFPKYQRRVTTLFDKQDKSLSAPVGKSESEQSSVFEDSLGKRKKLLIAGGGVGAIVLIILMASGGKNEPQKAPAIAPPAPAAVTPPTASSDQAPQLSTDFLQCTDINTCVALSLQDAGRGNFDGVRAAATMIEGFPKPDLGNRPVSRKLNSQGLDYFKQENYLEAIKLFKEAMNENPKDVEVVGNLGFAFLKNNQPKEAVNYLTKALLLDPRRTATWTPLAESYAQLGQDNYANAALAISYSWSSDRDKSKKFYQDQLEKNRFSNPKIANLYETILKNIAASN